MTATGAVIFLLLMLGCVGAAMFELWLAMRAHPRRWLYGWLAWTPLAVLGVSSTVTAGSGSSLEMAVTGLVIGPICYPIVRLLLWARNSRWIPDVEEAERDRARLQFQATDFGGARAAPANPASSANATGETRAVTQAPLTPLPADTPLAQTVSPPQSTLAKGLESAVLLAVGVALITLTLGMQFSGWLFDSGAPAAVAESLEVTGHPYARVRRNWWATHCPLDNFAYDWSAAGSQGRACVSRIDGEIQITIDKVWPAGMS